ncbi:hypothetical protein FB45DRAFT_1898 [Roridomyces roridus]|uniref:Uncharacterized protein n=1 Tax=Roridomyces roridus TaxID=1738132 RepID=A0AAD7FY98_9AGAR|nr:hypothetical protein FB45DRAFT_1898 [Roridomyces roridus]
MPSLDQTIAHNEEAIAAPRDVATPVPPRREYVWRTMNVPQSLVSIATQIARDLDLHRASIHRLVSSDGGSIHRCPGYVREEVTLATRTADSAVVSHDAPTIQEVCSVCHEVVNSGEVFRCVCGQEGTLDRAVVRYIPLFCSFLEPGSRPTVKCRSCKSWSHRDCNPTPDHRESICFLCLPSRFFGARLPVNDRICDEPFSLSSGPPYFEEPVNRFPELPVPPSASGFSTGSATNHDVGLPGPDAAIPPRPQSMDTPLNAYFQELNTDTALHRRVHDTQPAKSGPVQVYQERPMQFDGVHVQTVMDQRSRNDTSTAQRGLGMNGPAPMPAGISDLLQLVFNCLPIPPVELRRRGLPEEIIQFIENNRPALFKTAMDQGNFRAGIRPGDRNGMHGGTLGSTDESQEESVATVPNNFMSPNMPNNDANPEVMRRPSPSHPFALAGASGGAQPRQITRATFNTLLERATNLKNIIATQESQLVQFNAQRARIGDAAFMDKVRIIAPDLKNRKEHYARLVHFLRQVQQQLYTTELGASSQPASMDATGSFPTPWRPATTAAAV